MLHYSECLLQTVKISRALLVQSHLYDMITVDFSWLGCLRFFSSIVSIQPVYCISPRFPPSVPQARNSLVTENWDNQRTGLTCLWLKNVTITFLMIPNILKLSFVLFYFLWYDKLGLLTLFLQENWLIYHTIIDDFLYLNIVWKFYFSWKLASHLRKGNIIIKIPVISHLSS